VAACQKPAIIHPVRFFVPGVFFAVAHLLPAAFLWYRPAFAETLMRMGCLPLPLSTPASVS
jgi:hypothetical protein